MQIEHPRQLMSSIYPYTTTLLPTYLQGPYLSTWCVVHECMSNFTNFTRVVVLLSYNTLGKSFLPRRIHCWTLNLPSRPGSCPRYNRCSYRLSTATHRHLLLSAATSHCLFDWQLQLWVSAACCCSACHHCCHWHWHCSASRRKLPLVERIRNS